MMEMIYGIEKDSISILCVMLGIIIHSVYYSLGFPDPIVNFLETIFRPE